VLSQVKQPLSSSELFNLYRGDPGLFDTQYRVVSLVQCNTNEDITEEEVYQYKDASGKRAFEELALFALSMLSLLLSNADVERAFFQVNIIKSKLQNRMANKTLAGILHVQYGMRRQNICCTDFVPTHHMLVRFNGNMCWCGLMETCISAMQILKRRITLFRVFVLSEFSIYGMICSF